MRRFLQPIVAATLFGLIYGLSAPLIALRLAEQGYSTLQIGINAALHAAGVLLIAPLLPCLCRRFATQRLLQLALTAVAIVLLLFLWLPVGAWWWLRLLLGMAAEVILVVAESWLSQNSSEHSRAKNMALYIAMLSLGFAGGPLMLSIWGSGSGLFVAGSALAILATLCMLPSGQPPLATADEQALSLYQAIAMIPLALAAAVLNAAVETAGMNLLGLYAIRLGWGVKQASSLIAILLAGAIIMQLPIGWLADRYDRKRLLLLCSALSVPGALCWPIALGHLWCSYALLFCWGGVFVGIYTLMMTLIGARFQGAALTRVYTLLSLAWGAGALPGPLLGGAAMSVTRHGLPWLAALLCSLFLCLALWLNKRSG
ncbi:major facilitator transporter [Erwinia amylovora Ea644]|nr:major facilitator transporter [Erwinia amylovora Ea644]